MSKKYLIINFKTYEESFNKNGEKLINDIIKFKLDKKNKSLNDNIEIIVCPNILDLKDSLKNNKIKIFSQSFDNKEDGANTGSLIPKFLKQLNISGSLINHSEKKISLNEIKKSIDILKRLKMKSCVCSSSIKQIQKLKKLKPDFIAYEPKKLIGGNISVLKSKPKEIKEISKYKNGCKFLVGAGVKNKEDVEKSCELGANGILIASGFIKSKTPLKVLKNLLEGFKK